VLDFQEVHGSRKGHCHNRDGWRAVIINRRMFLKPGVKNSTLLGEVTPSEITSCPDVLYDQYYYGHYIPHAVRLHNEVQSPRGGFTARQPER